MGTLKVTRKRITIGDRLAEKSAQIARHRDAIAKLESECDEIRAAAQKAADELLAFVNK